MLHKHIKAVSLVLALCLIAVMFVIVVVTDSIELDAASPVASVTLLLFVVVACVPVFAAHEKHN